jgi:hypothetical protein
MTSISVGVMPSRQMVEYTSKTRLVVRFRREAIEAFAIMVEAAAQGRTVHRLFTGYQGLANRAR